MSLIYVVLMMQCVPLHVYQYRQSRGFSNAHKVLQCMHTLHIRWVVYFSSTSVFRAQHLKDDWCSPGGGGFGHISCGKIDSFAGLSWDLSAPLCGSGQLSAKTRLSFLTQRATDFPFRSLSLSTIIMLFWKLRLSRQDSFLFEAWDEIWVKMATRICLLIGDK